MPTPTTLASCRNAALVLALALTAGACAVRTSPGVISDLDVSYRVLLNGRLVDVNGESVLDLLSHANAGRLARPYPSTPDSEPAVVLDGVLLDGVYRLADVPAYHAASILVLRPVEASLRYGPRGSHGAILVTTKRGPSR